MTSIPAMALPSPPAPYGAILPTGQRQGRPGSWPPQPPQASSAYQEELAELKEVQERVERTEVRCAEYKEELRTATDVARARYATEKAALEAAHESATLAQRQEHAALEKQYLALRYTEQQQQQHEQLTNAHETLCQRDEKQREEHLQLSVAYDRLQELAAQEQQEYNQACALLRHERTSMEGEYLDMLQQHRTAEQHLEHWHSKATLAEHAAQSTADAALSANAEAQEKTVSETHLAKLCLSEAKAATQKATA